MGHRAVRSFTDTGHTRPLFHGKNFRLSFRGSGGLGRGAVHGFPIRKWHDLNYVFERSSDCEDNGLWEGRAEGCPGRDDGSLEEDSGKRE